MPAVSLYSAPDEEYLDHLSRCKDKLELLFPVYYSVILRTFDTSVDQEILRSFFLKMTLFHDLGKLTKKWQDTIRKEIKENKKLHKPSHSTLGAAFLWKSLPTGFKEPLSFAVAIHHTDRGLLGDNIERPDVQAITDGIVDYEGNIKWHEEAYKLDSTLFPDVARNITVNDLKEMAKSFRVWAKGCNLLEQHQRRLQASLAHHVLKLCDISAATERKEYQKRNEHDYYGGWLMVEHIKDYTDNVAIRKRYSVLHKELNRWLEILITSYQPLKVIIFGSIVTGEINEWSDIDLLIVKRTDKAFLDRTKEVLLLLNPKVGVDILVYTPDEFNTLKKERRFFIDEIIKKGVTLYEREF